MLAQLGSGVKWTYASMMIGAVIQVLVTAATARMLAPEAFGLIAMANVVLRFGGYVAQMGVGRALIQRPTIDDYDVRAAFTSSTVLGLIVSAVIFAAAPLAHIYYQTAEVVPVIQALAGTFVLGGLSATAGALLQRQLRFRESGLIEVLSYAIGYGATTLALAATGFGVWSLVGGTIGQLVVAGALAYGLTRHAVRPIFDPSVHRRLLGFGAKVSGISFLEFIGSTLDVLVIGRFSSAAQLGLYNRAFMLASLPTYRVSHGIARVLFPVLSAGQREREAFTEAFVAATRSATKLMVPLGIGMSLAAPEIVHVVLGDTWSDAVSLFAILAPSLALNVLATFPGLALESLGVLRGKAIVQFAYVIALGTILLASATNEFSLETITVIVGLSIVVRAFAYYVLAHRSGVLTHAHLISLVGTGATVALATTLVMTVVLNAFRSFGAAGLVTLTAAMVSGAAILLWAFMADINQWLRMRR